MLAQLGNRVQHALRAFTPDDAKALKAAVSTYPHSAYDLEELLTPLGTGEAVVTVLSEKGAPTPVAWTRMRAPQSLMAPSPDALLDADRRGLARSRRSTPTVVDRESAYEKLARPGPGAHPRRRRRPRSLTGADAGAKKTGGAPRRSRAWSSRS